MKKFYISRIILAFSFLLFFTIYSQAQTQQFLHFDHDDDIIEIPADLKMLQNYQSKIGSRIEIRYELSAPQHAKLNQVIGYWLEPKEILAAFLILIVLLIAAYATTHRPDAASLKEQIEYKKEDTGKYV